MNNWRIFECAMSHDATHRGRAAHDRPQNRAILPGGERSVRAQPRELNSIPSAVE
jgi:hypothetical protein